MAAHARRYEAVVSGRPTGSERGDTPQLVAKANTNQVEGFAGVYARDTMGNPYLRQQVVRGLHSCNDLD